MSLGHVLLTKKLIAQEQLDNAIVRQKMTGGRIEDHLVALGYLTQEQMEAIGQHTGKKFDVPFDELVVFSTNLSPEDLMDAAHVIEYEKVQIVNVNNGTRIETYLIKGKRGSGVCCLNGPAARQGAVGDIVIIISYARMDFEKAREFKPWVVFPKEGNML